MATQALISVTVLADHNEYKINLSVGSTVQQALKIAAVSLAETDKVEPILSTVLEDHTQVVVRRVKEEFYTEQVVLSFEHQELKNEALPEGERRLSQAGMNGLEEITYRRLFEDGVVVATNVFTTTILQEPKPEIEMVGTRSMTEAIALPGTLGYISAGNAWLIQSTTANRKLVISTGDLDGRIFSLSLDGKYLLFTRFITTPESINSLWLADIKSEPIRIQDLKVNNVIHFAAFNDASTRLAFSTADWQVGAPGWRANNDLSELMIYPDGTIASPEQILAPSAGGVYGWWGTEYAWSPDGLKFLFMRPDRVGIFDRQSETETSIVDIEPYQTGGNWAWTPSAAWSPDGKAVYTVDHVENGTAGLVESQRFDLITLPSAGGAIKTLVKDVGMFAQPVPSPDFRSAGEFESLPGENNDQAEYSVAYLQSLQPGKSDTSTYRLSSISQWGTDQKDLFPNAGEEGITPQRVAWSPTSVDEAGNFGIALVYKGNIWIIDAGTVIAQQITRDGLTTRIDWR